MRIAFLTTQYVIEDFHSGIASYVARAAQALADEGHQAEVFTLWRYSGYAEVIVPAWQIAGALRRRHYEAPFDIVEATNARAIGLVAARRKLV